MKKILYKAGACILVFLLFFNVSVKKIYATIFIPLIGEVAIEAIVAFAAAYAGTKLLDSGTDWVAKKLGWKSADIQVDENGNVILSQAQMNELKAALEEYKQENDYGMWWYESTKGYHSVESAMIAQTYDLTKPWNQELVSSGTSDIWVKYNSSSGTGSAVFAPNGAVWIAESENYAVLFYDVKGIGTVDTAQWSFYNGTHTWSINNYGPSGGVSSIYGGPGHVAFKTLADYREYVKDGSPYTLVAPTYTGGDLVISPDDLKNPDNPNNPDDDFDDDGNPVTEKGWLSKIYDRLGDILNQLKQIKWLTVGDVILNAIDTFGEGLGDIVGAVADSVSMVFPLCIAWDFVHLLEIFVAEPFEPIFTIPFKYELIGLDVTFTIDLTDWDWAVEMFRTFELLGFIVGLFNLTVAWVGKGDDV